LYLRIVSFAIIGENQEAGGYLGAWTDVSVVDAGQFQAKIERPPI
jgi:hypothetical protein